MQIDFIPWTCSTAMYLNFIRCCLIFTLFGCGTAVAGDQADIEATLQNYENAWSAHDPNAIASFYYEPAMRISPAGPVVRQTRKDQEIFFSGFLPSLIQRGFDKGKWEELNIHLLDSETAIASGIVIRTRKDASLFERVAISYGLRKTPQGWRIFLSDTHAPETVMRFR
jgi:ketosteroid isomerase-like protein